ncbi:hypothetical protein KL905_003063 [Ogataea polymorpha]|nr:hypothetical protein KL927_003335 [Ogataea polymorpha]KAG7921605.1 hypothetical protein KL905_003063 [Ogataea polymorpha]
MALGLSAAFLGPPMIGQERTYLSRTPIASSARYASILGLKVAKKPVPGVVGALSVVDGPGSRQEKK